MLCVNDWRNGMGLCRIEKVSIDETIELEGPYGWEGEEDESELIGTTPFDANATTVTIGGATFRHCGYREWVGNWCWDSATMDPRTVLDLLNHLKRLEWDCHLAADSLFE